ncbi:hypothetical protein D1007_37134 [Hordeum vulgare]|nr:hypothetical protein D1007_37134 [Hordeum vulgare]
MHKWISRNRWTKEAPVGERGGRPPLHCCADADADAASSVAMAAATAVDDDTALPILTPSWRRLEKRPSKRPIAARLLETRPPQIDPHSDAPAAPPRPRVSFFLGRGGRCHGAPCHIPDTLSKLVLCSCLLCICI